MRCDGGWIELLEPGASETSARAHLLVHDVAMEGGWSGELSSLRLAPGHTSLRPGPYLALYPRSGEAHPVDLEVADDGAAVRSHAGDLPAALREVSEGE
jgi:hypothetical protein